LSIALSTLLIIAGLIPGIAFLNTYYSGNFPRQLTGLSALSELALYFLWALPIDTGAFWLASAFCDRVGFDLSRGILAVATQGADIHPVYEFMASGGLWMCIGSYLSVVVLATILGTVARRLVWVTRLDARIPMLRLKAEWYYRLLGRTGEIPWHSIPQADILVTHPEEGSRLYVGVVSGFEASREGGIETISLRAAQRYKRRNDEGARLLVDIPGDVFSISGKTIHSINMRYYVVPGPSEPGARLRWNLENFWDALLRG
jgi:hypothetical protein